ncbi:MAG: pilus assembly protein PilM [Clostridiales bacterium]|nr:pilus assembly protein PilM [Clostridiales bacterium]
MKQSVAILDLGTSKITVLIGSRGINNTINLDGVGVCEYAGYSCGQWLDGERLSHCIGQAISSAQSRARQKIDKLYVGVPNEFSQCHVVDVGISLNKKRRVTEKDVQALLDSGNTFADPTRTVVNMQPIYYTLDNSHKLIEPVDMTSTKLNGSISYILARNDFIEDITAAAGMAEIDNVEFLSASLAELMLLFDDFRRDKCVMLADVGALGTALTIGRGDGICVQKYFAWGGRRITDALAEKFDIPYKLAEQLKRKVILSLEPDFVPPPDEAEPPVVQTEYELEVGGEIRRFDVAETNLTVRLEIEQLARYIKKALKQCNYDYPEYIPLSVTGGGIIPMRGAIEYLSECLAHDTEAVKPSQPMLDSAPLSSALGILNMVLLSNPVDDGVIKRFKRWFSKRKQKE